MNAIPSTAGNVPRRHVYFSVLLLPVYLYLSLSP
jgi:hypothetical protein